MTRSHFIRRHARLFSFIGVLLLTSGLVTLLFQEARAVTMTYSTAPTSVGSGGGTFVLDVIIPNGQRIPITSVDVVLEQQRADASDKFNPIVVGSVRCFMTGTVGSGCPADEPLERLRGVEGIITSITFVAAVDSLGVAIDNGYFGYGALTGTRTGYGYDTVSEQFVDSGNLFGYGYGYDTGDTGLFNIGDGDGYGYAGDSLILRFNIVVNGAVLAANSRFYLTTVLQTGSAIIGELSSPFAEFTTGGGGGGGGGGPITGGTFTPTIVGSTATATVTGTVGGTITIPLAGLNSVLGTLTLTLAEALTNAQITVTVSNTPTEGATAVPTGYDAFLYLSINAPAGSIAGGTLTFTLTDAQLAGNQPAQVVLLHFVNGAWVALVTTPSTTGPQGATFTATLPSFSPFAIAFDKAPPTITNLRPPEGSGATTRPLIAASVNDNRGINVAATRMLVDGQPVTATVTATEILYTPGVALTLGQHTVIVEAIDLSGLMANRTWTFNAAAAADSEPPTVTPVSPAKDSFTNNPRPRIEASYRDNLGIDTTQVTATLDGAAASAPAITATGVSFTPAVGLTDGKHTVTVTVADTSGNSAFTTWAFTVDTALPSVVSVEPREDATVTGLRPTIKVQYSDPLSGIATDKVRLTIDGVAVTGTATADAVTFTPTSDLAQGKHTARVDIADKAGNTASKEWSFTTVAAPQDFTLIIVLVLVLVAIVAGAAWWFMKNKKPPTG